MLRISRSWLLGLLVSLPACGVAQYAASATFQVNYQFSDKDTGNRWLPTPLLTQFDNQAKCASYLSALVPSLQKQGFLGASLDSLFWTANAANVHLFVGPIYRWERVSTDSIEPEALSQIGWQPQRLLGKPVDWSYLNTVKAQLLRYYQEHGYPFAAVRWQQVELQAPHFRAVLAASRGPLYHIDSIRVNGKVKLSNHYLQRQLGLPRGSLYQQSKLDQVSRRISEMPFVQEVQSPELVMLGTGGFLDLFLASKRASQINVLVGILPANNQTDRPQLTGDINLDLRNALGSGESILVNWQQLQVKSPRLKLGFNQPYLFRSAFGIDFSFELFKKDSSFLQLSTLLGVQYALSAKQTGKLFIQQQRTTLLGSGVDTQLVKQTRQLPALADVQSVSIGIDYTWNNTDYRLNPRRGQELSFRGSSGIRNIRRNNDIVNLIDPSFNFASLYDSIKLRTYQLRLNLQASQYFPVGKNNTIRLGFQGGWFASENPFRNELFQVGGFKTLRGFDEESIFANRYGILTAEYRLLLGRNSYGYAFSDIGLTRREYLQEAATNRFISGGLGLVFETKNGLLNMNLALGSRNDVNFDIRRGAKIHFGYVNFF